jgi:ligand-binding SRPBCC domain-containing protein
MTTTTFRTECWLPEPIGRVFSFFADAANLGVITPPWLHFTILTPLPITMRVGALIDYRLRVHGLPLRWQTEITGWAPPYRFVDEQRRGPYRLWVHTHTFEERDGGTLCRDQVDYAVSGGALIDRLFVRRDVKAIFAYRERALKTRFPAATTAAAHR